MGIGRGPGTISLAHVSPTFAAVEAIEVLSDKPSTEEKTRKYGVNAYTQPTTRQDYEETLWQLAEMVIQTNRKTKIDRPDYSENILRSMQLENQFNQVADQIELAKTKRRYILNVALIRKRWLSPAIAYPTKCEVEASLRDARIQIAKRGVSTNKRVRFERIVEKREKQLQKGLYREAVAAWEGTNHAVRSDGSSLGLSSVNGPWGKHPDSL